MNKFPDYPRISQRKFVSWNEEMFTLYNNERVYLHPNPIIRYIERRRVAKLLSYLQPILDSDKILAAGSGEGYIEKKIPTGKLTLIDLSKEAIKRAKKKLSGRKNITFLIADLEKIPSADKSYDKIECSEVIEHVYSPQKMLDEFSRVLNDRGFLVISFPNEPLINRLKKILIQLGLFRHFFPNVPSDMTKEWHLRAMDLQTFVGLTRKSWTIQSLSGAPFDFFPIRYIAKCQKKIRR